MAEDNGNKPDGTNDGGTGTGGTGGTGGNPPAGNPTGGAPATFDPKSLPQDAQEWLRAEIARNDAKSRTTSKTNAAKEERERLLGDISKALGLTETPTDPAALAQQLSAAQVEARTLKVERAIERSARKNNADEELLTAVLAHSGKLAALDPSSSTFASDVEALVKAEVDRNPRLKATPAATAPAPGAQGPADSGFRAGTAGGKSSVDDMSMDDVLKLVRGK